MKKELNDLLNSRAELRKTVKQNKQQLNERFRIMAKKEIDPKVLEEFGLVNKAQKFLNRIEEV